MITVEFKDFEDMVTFAEHLIGQVTATPRPAQATTQPAKTKPDKVKPVAEVSDEPKDPEPEALQQEEKRYTLEEVRARLADLNRAGKRVQVKELLSSFGVNKLSEIKEDQYSEVMEKAGEL